MSLRSTNLLRRRFLRSVGGATPGLPFLEVFGRGARKASAAAPVRSSWWT